MRPLFHINDNRGSLTPQLLYKTMKNGCVGDSGQQSKDFSERKIFNYDCFTAQLKPNPQMNGCRRTGFTTIVSF